MSSHTNAGLTDLMPGLRQCATCMPMQDLDDGLHHEDDESPGQQTFSLARLAGVDWGTSQSLKLGDNDFQPAILLEIGACPVAGPVSNT